MNESKLPPKYDPAGWSWVIDGKTVEITSLSRDDLIQALCESIEAIEQINERVVSIDDIVSAWRRGNVDAG